MPFASSTSSTPPLSTVDPNLVVAYLESRLRAILTEMQNAVPERAAWIEKLLIKEVVGPPELTDSDTTIDTTIIKYFAMTWIGLEVAQGRLVKIPILMTTLASRIDHEDESLNIDNRLRHVLDAGDRAPLPTGMVGGYVNDWWRERQNPGHQYALCFGRLMYCLDDYQKRLQETNGSASAPALPITVTPQDVPQPYVANDCVQCVLYRGAALDALEHMKQLQCRLRHLEGQYRDKWRQTMRRASGFNQLYEEAVVKEAEHARRGYEAVGIGSAPAPAPADVPTTSIAQAATSTVHKSSRPQRRTPQATNDSSARPSAPTRKLTKQQLLSLLRENAEAERDRLLQHPSLKWTWGVDLDANDISQMRRAGDTNYQRPHTGYDASLPWGKMTGCNSSTQRAFDGTAIYSSVDTPSHVRQLSSPDIPHHFALRPLRRNASELLDRLLPSTTVLPGDTAAEACAGAGASAGDPSHSDIHSLSSKSPSPMAIFNALNNTASSSMSQTPSPAAVFAALNTSFGGLAELSSRTPSPQAVYAALNATFGSLNQSSSQTPSPQAVFAALNNPSDVHDDGNHPASPTAIHQGLLNMSNSDNEELAASAINLHAALLSMSTGEMVANESGDDMDLDVPVPAPILLPAPQPYTAVDFASFLGPDHYNDSE